MADRDELIEKIPHGTYAGYQRERRLGLDACESCRMARNAYMSDVRKRRPDYYERGKLRDRASDRARRRLARRHREEFEALLAEELTPTSRGTSS